MANYLDITLPIVEQDLETGEYKATSYFEDYLQIVVDSLGGEGSDIVSEITSTTIQADKIPHLFALIHEQRKRINSLESSLSTYIVEAAVRQLQVDTAPFNTIIKRTNYTAKNKDYVEAFSSSRIYLPADPIRGDQVIIANGDGSQIKADGNGEMIKYTSTANVFNIVRPGSSKHFHFFKDETTQYWRAR